MAIFVWARRVLNIPKRRFPARAECKASSCSELSVNGVSAGQMTKVDGMCKQDFEAGPNEGSAAITPRPVLIYMSHPCDDADGRAE